LWAISLYRPRNKREIIRMNVKDIWCDVDWIHLTQDKDHQLAVVSSVMHFRFRFEGGSNMFLRNVGVTTQNTSSE
jgi:hypothetical protein